MRLDIVGWYYVWIEFLTQKKTRAKSAAAFCRELGHNENTGRKMFNRLQTLADEHGADELLSLLQNGSISTKGTAKKGGSPKKGSIPLSDESNSGSFGGQKISQRPLNQTEKPAEKRKRPDPTPNIHKPSNRITTSSILAIKDASSDAQILNRGRFTKGNAAAVKSGRYMNLLHTSPDILEALTDNDDADLWRQIELGIFARSLMMDKITGEKIHFLQTCSDSQLPADQAGNKLRREDLIAQATFSTSSQQAAVLGSLCNVRTTAIARLKMQIEAEEKELKAEAARRKLQLDDQLKELMALRTFDSDGNANIPALELVRLLEANGINPPPLLAAEAIYEIEHQTPPDTDTTTDTERDQMMRDYERYQSASTNKLLERASKLPGMLAAAKAKAEHDANSAFGGEIEGTEN